MTSSTINSCADPYLYNASLYDIFGLCLSLPFPAPLLTPAPSGTPIDIHVTLGETPQSLPHPYHEGRNELLAADIQISSQGEMLWTTARARLWATGGHTIVVEPFNNSKPASLGRFVLYDCLPAILNQRGLLTLHANSLVGPHGAMIITGRSGAGKSTLLAALMTRGLLMLADDVTVMQEDGAGRPLVLPGYPSYRLCADTLAQIEPPADRVIAVGGERNKYLILPPKTTIYSKPAPLHTLYFINIHEGDTLQMSRIEGSQAFHLVQENCYNPAASLLIPHAFQQIARVIQNCTIYQINRPATRWTLDEIVELLLAPE